VTPSEELSPNQRQKRQQIVEAARRVLAEQGLAACSVRAIADASPLTKSAIHYYFRDVDEIVDEALAEHVDAMLANLRRAAEGAHEDRLWAVVTTYLDTFAAQPNAAFLWFEYWIDAGRRQAVDGIAATVEDMRTLLAELLAPLPVDDPAETADALLSWLLGTVVQQQIRPRSPARLRRELNALAAGSLVPAPEE